MFERGLTLLLAKDNIKARVKALYHDKKFLNNTQEIPKGAQFGLLLDQTNFYAEQGGQENDTGRIIIDDAAEFDVQDVQAYGGYVLHVGFMNYGSLSAGDEVICEFDEVSFSIPSSHSAKLFSFDDNPFGSTILVHTY